MAYTNETTHYGLPLPTGSDLTVPMDYNESFEEIDTVIFEAQTNAAGAVGTAGNALDVANSANTAAAEATTTANGATATAQAAATAANEAVAAVAEAKDDALDMICAVVEETATAQYKHEPTPDGLNYYFRYNDILYKTTAVINVGETIVPNTNCAATNVATELVNIEDVDITGKLDTSALKVAFGTRTTTGLISYTASEDTPITFVCNNSATASDAQVVISIIRDEVEHTVYNQSGSARAGASVCLVLNAGDVFRVGFNGTGLNVQYACNVELS